VLTLAAQLGTQCLFHAGRRNNGKFFCVSYQQKVGALEMNRYDEELLDKQMGKLTPPQDDGAIAVWLIATFLAGATLGAVLSAH
jgi:hypothetical protein